MTRICEKFIDEITSGSAAVSEELTQHLASCSACREAFESLRQLKDARKPLTGKEAVAIAGILKAVKSGTTASTAAASGQAAGSSALALKPLILAACILSIIAAMFMHGRAPQIKDDKVVIQEPVKEPIVRVDETDNLTDNVKVASETVNVANGDQQSDDVEPASASSDVEAQEGNKTGEAQTIFVSPDQENVELR